MIFRGSIPHPMQSLCTLRNHCRQWPRNTRYQADATPYLGRTCTGWIAPALPGALILSPSSPLTGVTEYWSGFTASVRLDVGRPDHLGPLLGFVGNERFEIGRRASEDNPAQIHELCLHFGIGEASIDLLVELVDDPGRCPCRCSEAEIAARLIARHEFADSRKVRQRVRARGRAHRKGAQPSRPDVLDRGRHGVETDLHLSGEKID